MLRTAFLTLTTLLLATAASAAPIVEYRFQSPWLTDSGV